MYQELNNEFLEELNNELCRFAEGLAKSVYNPDLYQSKLSYSVNSLKDSAEILIPEPGINKDNSEIQVKNKFIKISTNINNIKKEITLRPHDSLNLKKINASCKDGILKIQIQRKKDTTVNIKIE